AAARDAARSTPVRRFPAPTAPRTRRRPRRRAPASASGPDRADRLTAVHRAGSLPRLPPTGAGLPDLGLGDLAAHPIGSRSRHLVGGQREARPGTGALAGLHHLELGIAQPL